MGDRVFREATADTDGPQRPEVGAALCLLADAGQRAWKRQVATRFECSHCSAYLADLIDLDPGPRVVVVQDIDTPATHPHLSPLVAGRVDQGWHQRFEVARDNHRSSDDMYAWYCEDDDTPIEIPCKCRLIIVSAEQLRDLAAATKGRHAVIA